MACKEVGKFNCNESGQEYYPHRQLRLNVKNLHIHFQVENRAEKAEKLKIFALGQFHNHFSLKSDRESREKYLNSVECIKDVQVKI